MVENVLEHEKKVLDLQLDLNERIRSMFFLRNIDDDSAAHAISKALYDDSELLAHEAAYILGQMKRTCVLPILINVLKDKLVPPVVRHEAGEAIAAIGDPSSIQFLDLYANDSQIEVSETCEIGRDRLKFLSTTSEVGPDPVYGSVDPAPPHPSTDVEFLESLLLDETQSLFDRYRAMFALRNLGTERCVEALSKGFKCRSALFKHEIAFVFGQMRRESSVDVLIQVMDDTSEHPMARHEAAEALGNIASPKCTKALTSRLNDPERIVRESCCVALDIATYQNSPAFQYVC